ncbi:MAG: hypothetical protein AAF616_10675 [Bacteroidota bacterium]
MRALIILITFSSICTVAAQEEASQERLDEKIDQLTYAWDLEADKLASYNGLQNLCADAEYREEVFGLLKEIHHYDTVLYEVLKKLSRTSKDKEIQKTMKDIKKFEREYDTKSFIKYMRKECSAMLEIEADADDTKNEVGYTSYSSQVYLLETELIKYVKQVTRRVDKIRAHVHDLSQHYSN